MVPPLEPLPEALGCRLVDVPLGGLNFGCFLVLGTVLLSSYVALTWTKLKRPARFAPTRTDENDAIPLRVPAGGWYEHVFARTTIERSVKRSIERLTFDRRSIMLRE